MLKFLFFFVVLGLLLLVAWLVSLFFPKTILDKNIDALAKPSHP